MTMSVGNVRRSVGEAPCILNFGTREAPVSFSVPVDF
jgi:hypothetical protein